MFPPFRPVMIPPSFKLSSARSFDQNGRVYHKNITGHNRVLLGHNGAVTAAPSPLSSEKPLSGLTPVTIPATAN